MSTCHSIVGFALLAIASVFALPAPQPRRIFTPNITSLNLPPVAPERSSVTITVDIVNTTAATARASALALATSTIPIGATTDETFDNIGNFGTKASSDPTATLLRDYSIYENGMYTGRCAPVTVIYARGTLESGNVGTLTGPPFFDTLRALIGTGNVAVQGVDYAADSTGFFEGGDIPGSELMATLTTAVLTACPYTKLCLSGYSQGSQVVHKAATLLPATTTAAVNSVVLFGDPYYGYKVQGVPLYRTLTLCHTGDDICAHGDLVLQPHMNYADDALIAALFVARMLYIA